MAKTTPIRVYLWATRHDQPWNYAIDEPTKGPMLFPRARYTRKSDAKRGALRKVLRLGLHLVKGQPKRSIEFIATKPPKRK